ncbi:MAG: PmoA family protein [Verrucomicrobiales bacterium]|jgi:hypothetical protein|nr:PmoA family protein [Verrucomicrobiales bacterium]
MKKIAILSAVCTLLASPSFADFQWKDSEGKHLDLFHDGQPVARYVYEAIDESSKERREETYKPFCHIYQWWSKDQFLTKGPGGKYTHHRGIYYGFSRVSYTDADGKTHGKIDTWHCRDAHQIHRKFTKQEAGKSSAAITSEIDWIDNEGNAFAVESRTMTFSRKNKDIVVDFTSTLTPKVPEVQLDGDPQHAGFQFRANNEVNDSTKNATYYIRPVTGVGERGKTINWSGKNDTEATRDLPWKAMCVSVGGKTYTIAYLDSPDNPKPARFSERDYGRFGSYFVATVTPEDPLTVNYRLIIRMGEMEPEEIEKWSKEFVAN